MRYGLFSDVHANWEALTVVLTYLEQENVDAYLFCGDIVGYGPDPNRCAEKIFSLKNLIAVSGNHDLAVIGRKDLDWFNPTAQQSLSWTTQQLKARNRKLLQKLPSIQTISNFTVVHGSARQPSDEYLFTITDCLETLHYFSTPIIFCGHTHRPFWFFTRGEENYFQNIENEDSFQLSGEKNILNIGSVGQPRDGNRQACCAIFDQEKNAIKFKRLEYDLARTQEKMLQAQLPAYLIERLASGV
ncbi:MAG: metallophosphoesterase family protein [Elusimicrobiota bacterium]